MNFWIKENAERNIGGRLITLKLSNVSLLDAVRYTSELAGCTMRYDSIAMVLGDPETIRDIPKFRPLPGNQMYKRLGKRNRLRHLLPLRPDKFGIWDSDSGRANHFVLSRTSVESKVRFAEASQPPL